MNINAQNDRPTLIYWASYRGVNGNAYSIFFKCGILKRKLVDLRTKDLKTQGVRITRAGDFNLYMFCTRLLSLQK